VTQLVASILEPLATMWDSVVHYLPNLIFLIVIGVLTWVSIRVVGLVFSEIERQTIRIAGFEPDWAPFTAKIVELLLIVAAVVFAFPYLPGSESPALRGATIFLGALGLALVDKRDLQHRRRRNSDLHRGLSYRDVIRVGNNVGEVVGKTLLVMRIRMWKNEIVSVPNSQALNQDVTNYTALAKTTGLVLHTAVTIGYDAPWRQVHGLMIAAGRKTPGVRAEPEPFVLQTSLNDYNVSYGSTFTRTSPLAFQVFTPPCTRASRTRSMRLASRSCRPPIQPCVTAMPSAYPRSTCQNPIARLVFA
jgi:small-conductance mechanosensitive channel